MQVIGLNKNNSLVHKVSTSLNQNRAVLKLLIFPQMSSGPHRQATGYC